MTKLFLALALVCSFSVAALAEETPAAPAPAEQGKEMRKNMHHKGMRKGMHKGMHKEMRKHKKATEEKTN